MKFQKSLIFQTALFKFQKLSVKIFNFRWYHSTLCTESVLLSGYLCTVKSGTVHLYSSTLYTLHTQTHCHSVSSLLTLTRTKALTQQQQYPRELLLLKQENQKSQRYCCSGLCHIFEKFEFFVPRPTLLSAESGHSGKMILIF